MAESIVLIKIGGSLITNKEKPFSLNKKGLAFICREIKKAQKLNKKLIIGHGSGSFAHFPAKKYQTSKGLAGEQSKRGAVETAQAAARLNQIVVQQLLAFGIKAVSIAPSSAMTSENDKLKSLFLEPIEKSLLLGLTPVLYGDLIFDQKKGWTIFSTEKILNCLAFALKKRGYLIEKIIYCGLTRGVYNLKGKTISCLSNKNFKENKKAFGKSNGIDVTGGMLHKTEEILKAAKKGIPGLIINGKEKNNLPKAIAGKKIFGTKILWITNQKKPSKRKAIKK